MIDDTVARCGGCGTRYTSRSWPWLESLGGEGLRRVCAVAGCGAVVDRTPRAANGGGRARPPENVAPVDVVFVDVPMPAAGEARFASAFVESSDPHDCGPLTGVLQGQRLQMSGPGFDFDGTLAEFCAAMRARLTMAEADRELRSAETERRAAREWMAEAAQCVAFAHRNFGDGKARVLRLVKPEGER